MKVTFRMVRIGEMFTLNGNTYVKKSTRTASMIGLGKTGDYCLIVTGKQIGRAHV